MERLTYQDKDGGIFCPWERNSVNGSYDIWDEEGLIQQINRLAAYEDTGLDPEQVLELKSFTQGGIHKVDAGWKHVQKLLQAEQEGRLVVLPCKVGEYWRDRDGERVRIESVSFSFTRRHLCNTDMVTYRYDEEEDDFAVNWIYFKSHFTREEAEAVLAQEGGTHETDSV